VFPIDSDSPELRTDRLLLRRWTAADRQPFAAMNADPDVMEHFVAPLSPLDSNAAADRIESHFRVFGYGLWAVQVDGGPAFAGFVGLDVVTFAAHFTPAIEIAWRLARSEWGRGYAVEAGRAVLRYAFARLRLDEVVAFTSQGNTRSERVMVRLAMTHDEADDFDHLGVPDGHRLRRHVLYRISADRWRSRQEE